MTPARDSKGRFVTPCKFKQFKNGLNNNLPLLKCVLISLLIVFALITGWIWLFSVKETTAVGEQERSFNASCYHFKNSYISSYIYDNPCLPTKEKYTYTVYSRYTIPEAARIVASGIVGIITGSVNWMLKHPVI